MKVYTEQLRKMYDGMMERPREIAVSLVRKESSPNFPVGRK